MWPFGSVTGIPWQLHKLLSKTEPHSLLRGYFFLPGTSHDKTWSKPKQITSYTSRFWPFTINNLIRALHTPLFWLIDMCKCFTGAHGGLKTHCSCHYRQKYISSRGSQRKADWAVYWRSGGLGDCWELWTGELTSSWQWEHLGPMESENTNTQAKKHIDTYMI